MGKSLRELVAAGSDRAQIVAVAATIGRPKWAHREGIGQSILMMVRQLSAVVVVLIGALVVSSAVRAERVGYSFQGTLYPTTSPTVPWFGMTLDTPTGITGTFSYDTTITGIDAGTGVRSYPQSIAGGYSLHVDFAPTSLVVEASDYKVTVCDNVKANPNSAPTDQFILNYTYDPAHSYVYDRARNLTPRKLLVNDAEWPSQYAMLIFGLSWNQATFSDADEPKLTADRPSTGGATLSSIFGDSPPPAKSPTLSISQISRIIPQQGDYNVDGKVDDLDYIEWRKAAGESASFYMYADGNGDGTVDAADYLVWRKALGSPLTALGVPEPGALFLLASGVVLFRRSRGRWRHDAQQR